MLEESTSRASSKKKKRLDKYINRKLKKDERLKLFEKLACVPFLPPPSSSPLHPRTKAHVDVVVQ